MSSVRTSEGRLLSLLTLTLFTAGLTWYGFINVTPTMTPIAIATALSPLIPEPLGETIYRLLYQLRGWWIYHIWFTLYLCYCCFIVFTIHDVLLSSLSV